MRKLAEKEMELTHIEGMIGLLTKGIMFRIPVGVVTAPNIDMKKIVIDLLHGIHHPIDESMSEEDIGKMYTKKLNS